MVKGVLVNPKKGVEKIETSTDLDTLYKLLNCRCIDITYRYIGKKDARRKEQLPGTYVDVLIVCDDEGLLIDNPIPSAIDSNNKIQLCGNLLILKDVESESFDDCSLTDEEIDFIISKNTSQLYYVKGNEDIFLLTNLNY